MQSLSPQQLAAMKQAMAARSAAVPEKLSVGDALSAAKALAKAWGTTAMYYGTVPLLFYTGMRACDVTLGDLVASVCSLPLL